MKLNRTQYSLTSLYFLIDPQEAIAVPVLKKTIELNFLNLWNRFEKLFDVIWKCSINLNEILFFLFIFFIILNFFSIFFSTFSIPWLFAWRSKYLWTNLIHKMNWGHRFPYLICSERNIRKIFIKLFCLNIRL